MPKLNGQGPPSDKEVMEKTGKWQTALGYSGSESLAEALIANKISQEKYLAWASQNYLLPILKPEFSNSTPPNFLWHSVQSLAPWSAELVPIGEWEQVLLIACLEPPTQPINFPHCLVLAPAHEIRILWRQLNPTVAPPREVTAPTTPPPLERTAPIVPPPLPEIPEGLQAANLDAPPPIAKTPEGLASVDEDQLAEFGEAPEGLSAVKPEVSLSEPEGIAVESVDTNASRSIVVDFAPPTKQPEAKPIALATEKPFPPKLDEARVETVNEKNPTFPPPPLPKQPPGLEVAKLEPEKNEVASPAAIANEISIHNFKVGTAAPAKVTVGNLEMTRTYEEATNIAFQMTEGTYEKAMLLLFQGGELKPWKWTNGFAIATNDKPTSINLKSANIFRIVFNSHLPYHGKIQPNPINDAFFAQYNKGVTPKHVTIVPIQFNKSMVAMLLAATDQPIDSKASLALMERLAEHLASTFNRIKKAA